ncbi:MAG: hypothetical protein ACI83B_002583 [Sediminicola sp.]|jgi:hypothetical protein
MKCISELKNKYRGERCFILGNGPSLNKTDVLKLKNEYTFAVNSIFLMTETNGFRPSFYVVEDNLVFKENKDKIDDYEEVTKIMPKHYAEQLSCKDECFVFDMDQDFYHKGKRNRFAIPYFNDNNTVTFFCGQSVTFINMQLALYLGFDEVYLIGMDFSYSIPSGHKQEGNHIKSEADDANHFHKDYFGKGKTWKDPRLGRVLRAYHMAKFAFDSTGKKIFNATPGGELELFERVNFESLL